MPAEFYGEGLSVIRSWAGWPTDPEVWIIPGGAGHEQEILATFGTNYDGWDAVIPDFLEGLVANLLPKTWQIDNRGSRLEFHPSGRHYGGWHEDDVAAIERAMEELGLKPEVRRFA